MAILLLLCLKIEHWKFFRDALTIMYIITLIHQSIMSNDILALSYESHKI